MMSNTTRLNGHAKMELMKASQTLAARLAIKGHRIRYVSVTPSADKIGGFQPVSMPPMLKGWTPFVGAELVTDHLTRNEKQFVRFMRSLDDPRLDPSVGPGTLALSVRKDRIAAARSQDIPRGKRKLYEFSCTFPPDVTRNDIWAAMKDGGLQFLASIQILVRLIIEMSEPDHPASGRQIAEMMNAIDQDAQAMFQLIIAAIRRRSPHGKSYH